MRPEDDDLDALLEAHGIAPYRPPPYDGARDFEDPPVNDYPPWMIVFVVVLWLVAAGMAVAVAVEIVRH